MKKFIALGFVVISLSIAAMAFAQNNVSEIPTSSCGESTSQCSEMMDKDVSECGKMTESSCCK